MKYLQVKTVPVPHKDHEVYKPFYYKDTDTSTHVSKRDVRVKPPLTRPYTGPFKVVK